MKTVLWKVIAISLLFLSGCSQPIPVKTHPDYVGVDPKAQKLVSEYLWLSKQNNITFKDPVSVGFTKINQGDVVGLCTFGGYFREIDLDIDFWNNSTQTQHLTLLFHELTHCYCSRPHDWSDGKTYPEKPADRLKQALNWLREGGPRPGYLTDGCPSSFMFPSVLDDDCVNAHYNEYIQEMFDHCDPW